MANGPSKRRVHDRFENDTWKKGGGEEDSARGTSICLGEITRMTSTLGRSRRKLSML